jgi:hypothetical protein
VRQLLPELATVTETAVGFQPSWYFDDSALVSWAVGGVGSGTASFTTGIGFCQVPGGTPHIVATSTSGDAYAVDNGAGQFFVWQANTIYLIDPATWTIVAGPVTATSADADCPFRGVVTGDSSIWISFTRYSTLDLSVIETVDPTAWPSGTSAPSHAIYDRINDALWSDFILESVTTVRLLTAAIASPGRSMPTRFIDVEEMFAAATAGNDRHPRRVGRTRAGPGEERRRDVHRRRPADRQPGQLEPGLPVESNAEWVNTVVARYIEPDQKWNDHARRCVRVTPTSSPTASRGKRASRCAWCATSAGAARRRNQPPPGPAVGPGDGQAGAALLRAGRRRLGRSGSPTAISAAARRPSGSKPIRSTKSGRTR